MVIRRFWLLAAVLGVWCCGNLLAAADIADVPCRKVIAGGDKNKAYFLIGVEEAARSPKEGYSLLVVLPGGDGGEGFNSFVRRIYKNALNPKYIVAQPIAVKWTKGQQVVWPTEKLKADKQLFSTEEFIAAVIGDVKGRYKVNPEKIFTLAWSSSGGATYAVSLDKQSSVTGSYIAMSVFKPDLLGPLANAAGHGYVIEHSPEDKVCPFRMAQQAVKELRKNKAKVKLVQYKGGHGWKGKIYPRIRYGLSWLEKNHGKPPRTVEVSEDESTVSEEAESDQAQQVQVEDIGIEPLVGVGMLRFGMSSDEVVKLLGQPDMIEGNGMGLRYLSTYGLTLLVHPVNGVAAIDVWSKDYPYPGIRIKSFAGRSRGGVGMGSSKLDVLKAFGEPDRSFSQQQMMTITYENLRMNVMFMRDKVVNIKLQGPVVR